MGMAIAIGVSRAPQGAAAGGLGKTTDFSSNRARPALTKPPRRRQQTEAERSEAAERTSRERWRLLEASAKYLHYDETRVKSHRVCYCCKRIGDGKPGVACVYVPEKQAGYLGGLVRCESVWVCPMCAATITEDRRRDLQTGLRLARQLGYKPVLLTFTFRHDRHQRLLDQRKKFMKAMTRMKSGRDAKARNDQFGKAGEIGSREVTWGESNGYHPHAHEIWLLAGDADVKAFEEAMREAWADAASKEGLSMNEHGFDCQETDEAVGNYVAKWGEWSVSSELTKWHSKRGGRELNEDGTEGERRYTPFDILRAAADGDQGDPNEDGITPEQVEARTRTRMFIGLWREYAAASKGWRQLQWSRGLRERLGMKQEKTEAEIIQESEEQGVLLDLVTPEEWRMVLANGARHELSMATRSGDPRNIWALLAALDAREPIIMEGELDLNAFYSSRRLPKRAPKC